MVIFFQILIILGVIFIGVIIVFGIKFAIEDLKTQSKKAKQNFKNGSGQKNMEKLFLNGKEKNNFMNNDGDYFKKLNSV